jgi:protein SCO1/2
MQHPTRFGDARRLITRPLTLSLFAGLSILAGMAVAVLLLRPPPAQIQSGTLLEKPRPIVDFTLTGEDGKPFTRADLLGHWDLIYVGYTYCPDVCPTTLATLKDVHKALGADAAKVRVVFLSVDPERDTPERLAQYVHYFSPAFKAITGDKAQLDALGSNLGFVYMKVPGPTPQTYSMDHSAALILVNPQAELAGFVSPPLIAETLAADLRSLVAGR